MVHIAPMTTTTRRITGTEAIEAKEADYSVTLHKYADPTEGARHNLTVDEARQIAREDAGLIWADVADYSGYTVRISNEPSYYGSECTEADAERIVESLGNLIRSEFPDINIEPHTDGTGSSKTTGPDEAVVDEINQWISDNWTAAL